MADNDDRRLNYRLQVLQQPIRARMLGFGSKDRRPIDPPVILQLHVTEQDGTAVNLRTTPFDEGTIVAMAEIYSVDCERALTLAFPPNVMFSSSSCDPVSGAPLATSSSATAATTTSTIPSTTDPSSEQTLVGIQTRGGRPKKSKNRRKREKISKAPTGDGSFVTFALQPPPTPFPLSTSSSSISTPSFPALGQSSSSSAAAAVQKDDANDEERDDHEEDEEEEYDEEDDEDDEDEDDGVQWDESAPKNSGQFTFSSGTTVETSMGQRNLVGTVHSPANILKVDNQGNLGVVFAFHDLSVRACGQFRLKISVLRLPLPPTFATFKPAEIFTDPFEIFTARTFPGMTNSTPLSRLLFSQGIRIPLRSGLRSKDAVVAGIEARRASATAGHSDQDPHQEMDPEH